MFSCGGSPSGFRPTVYSDLRVIVMDGAIIPDDVMLAAGCLVSPGKILESGFLYVGSPAKKSRELTENENAFLLHSAKHYVGLKNKHIGL